MSSNVVKYLLIVSLALNVSFLGAAGYTHYMQARYHAPGPFAGIPPGQGPFGRGMPMRGQPGAMVPGWMFQELGLKPEQIRTFQQKARGFRADLYQKGEEMDQARAELFRLVRAEDPDQKTIDATISRINRMQEEMQKRVVANMLEFKSMLDRDQQKKFFDMMERSMPRRGGMQCR